MVKVPRVGDDPALYRNWLRFIFIRCYNFTLIFIFSNLNVNSSTFLFEVGTDIGGDSIFYVT